MAQLSIPQSHGFERITPVAFAPLPATGECLLAAATSPTTIELFRFHNQDPSVEKLAELKSPDRLPVVSLAFDPTCGRLAAGSAVQIVQVWDLTKIREGLRQHGLASDFPEFRSVSPDNVCFSVTPPNQTEDDKFAALFEEEWLTRIDALTEQIEAAATNGGQDLFSDLLRRGRAYRGLRRYEMALRDFSRALELRPDDPEVRDEKSHAEQELELKR